MTIHNGPACVYGLYDPCTKTIFYVGVSHDARGRVSGHKTDANSAAWRRAQELIDKGMMFELVVLAEFKTRSEAHRCEYRLLSEFPGLLNRARYHYKLKCVRKDEGWAA